MRTVKTDPLADARHVDRSERIAAGRARRSQVPRRDIGDWTPDPSRPDPVDVLVAESATRIPELLPIRYGRMATSAFAFFRGAAAIMAGDLAGGPTAGMSVQLCGDGHLLNFGGFGTPERRLIFDVNDFDETLPGPWEWDLQRLAASFAVAARDNDFDDVTARESVAAVVRSYAKLMARLATMPTLDAWYTSVDVEQVRAIAASSGERTMAARADRVIARAHSRDTFQALGKLTEVVDGHRRIVDQPPLVEHVITDADAARAHALFDEYLAVVPDEVTHLLSRFRLVDVARKVVGVGSVGTRCWMVLLEGDGPDDALLLQVKEAEASVLAAHSAPSVYDNHARRVVEGQRLTQAASDLFLGWTRDVPSGTDYYWRQLRDLKVSADVASMQPPHLVAYGRLCGVTLARAHARSGDAAAISGYVGKGNVLGKALARFALTYADQNRRDHAALVQAIAAGRIPSRSGI